MDDDIPGFDFRQRTTSKVAAHEKSLTIDSDDREHTTDSDPEAIPSKFFSIKALTLEALLM